MSRFLGGIAEGMGHAIGMLLIFVLCFFLLVLLIYWGVKSGYFSTLIADTVKKSFGLG